MYHINSLRKFYETDDANEGTLNMMIVDEVDADELKQLWEEPCYVACIGSQGPWLMTLSYFQRTLTHI